MKEEKKPKKNDSIEMSRDEIEMKEMMKREMLERIEGMILTNNEAAMKAIKKMMGKE